MKCSISEEQLSLYGSSDLSAQESAAVAEHLTKCALCRDTLADLQFSHQLFAESSAEPDCNDLHSVRDVVMQRLRQRREQSRWVLPAAIAAAMFITVPILVRNNIREDRRQTMTVASLAALPISPIPSLDLPDLARVNRAHHRRPKGSKRSSLRAVVLSTAPDGSSELKLATADPNVIILLQMDGITHEN
ncbi:MAG: hypothetical protein JWP08_921 [Bryobacterales bacterium]|nr:hypothetical protein [Bryobacterales bacterium]